MVHGLRFRFPLGHISPPNCFLLEWFSGLWTEWIIRISVPAAASDRSLPCDTLGRRCRGYAQVTNTPASVLIQIREDSSRLVATPRTAGWRRAHTPTWLH